jgi:hypothetical protein
VTDEEAVARVEFWTLTVAESGAIGVTSDPLIGLHLNGVEHRRAPGKLGWSITVPRYVPGPEGKVENSVYGLVTAEIQHRAEIQRRKEEEG